MKLLIFLVVALLVVAFWVATQELISSTLRDHFGTDVLQDNARKLLAGGVRKAAR